MHTRIAPTPSGFLHLGNAANALATAWWASSQADSQPGTLAIRIDDLDPARVRPEYTQDIFDVLSWLGIDWVSGPTSTEQAETERPLRIGQLRQALDAALALDLPAYVCRCSRRDLVAVPTGGCPGGCRSRDLSLEPDRSALRLAVDRGTTIRVNAEDIDLAREMGDLVLWRRDDLPSYQWSSTVEDLSAGVTHILRGVDLLPSTAAQMHIAQLLQGTDGRYPEVRHHPLLTDSVGAKLSKSQTTNGQPLLRDDRTRALVADHARKLANSCGIYAHGPVA